MPRELAVPGYESIDTGALTTQRTPFEVRERIADSCRSRPSAATGRLLVLARSPEVFDLYLGAIPAFIRVTLKGFKVFGAMPI